MKTFLETYKDEVANSSTPYTAEHEMVQAGLASLSRKARNGGCPSQRRAITTHLIRAQMYATADQHLAAAQELTFGFSV